MKQGAVTDERDPEALAEAGPAADGAEASGAGDPRVVANPRHLPVDDDIDIDGIQTEEDYAAAAMRIREQGALDIRRTVFGLMRSLERMAMAQVADDEWARTIVGEYGAAKARRLKRVEFVQRQITDLAEDMLPVGPKAPKYVDVPGLGRIQYVDHKTGVEVTDKDALLAWAKAAERTDLYEVETVEKLKTTDAKKVALEVLTAGGELLPGIDEVPSHRTASIKLGGR